jgi:hypothetical protein
LAARSATARVVAGNLRGRSHQLVERSAVLCDEAARCLADFRTRRAHLADPSWFVVTGRLDAKRVTAEWRHGELWCDDVLRSRAGLLTALGEVFELPERPDLHYDASLDGPPIAVLLTLLRALDQPDTIAFG